MCKNRQYKTSITSKLIVQNRQNRLFAVLGLEIDPNIEKLPNDRETYYPGVFWALDSISDTFESIRSSYLFLLAINRNFWVLLVCKNWYDDRMDSKVSEMEFSSLQTYIPRVSSRFMKVEDFVENLVEQMTVNRFFGFFMTVVLQIQSLYACFWCRFPANFRRGRPPGAKIGNRKPLIRRNWRCKIVKIHFLRFWGSKSIQISKNCQMTAKLGTPLFFEF